MLLFKEDDSQKPDSMNYHWSETLYDGQPDSLVPAVPSHWHKYHDEHMEVTRGRVELTAEGKTTILKAGDPKLVIPRWHVHGFSFIKGEAATLKEYTDPPGNFKDDFFENLYDDGELNFTSLLRGCYRGDTYLSLPGGIQLLDQVFMNVAGSIVSYFYPQKNKGVAAENVAKESADAKL